MLKIEQLLQKEMTRKEFLGTLGLLVISIFGLSTIFGLFTKSSSSIEQTGLIGYGMHDYGP